MLQPLKGVAREAVREGADEVREKLREDLGRWARARRLASLKPTIGCLDCDAAGKLVCQACGGAGKQNVVFSEDREPEPCARCDGTGAITCVACAGRGSVENVHRKKIIWVLGLGGVAWLYVLFRLWGGDVLPEQRANLLQRGEHGSAVVGARRPLGGSGVVPSPGATQAPVGAPQAPVGQPAPSGGYTPSGVQPYQSGQPIQTQGVRPGGSYSAGGVGAQPRGGLTGGGNSVQPRGGFVGGGNSIR